jgi:hypothetical protein
LPEDALALLTGGFLTPSMAVVVAITIAVAFAIAVAIALPPVVLYLPL